jgi:DNA-binding transcriptional LysR family regulator
VVFRVAFVAGVTPDKWVRTWRRRETAEPLELILVDEADQQAIVMDGRADVCFARMPIDRVALHCIPLYSEVPVVVVPKDHPVTAYDEVPLADLVHEQLVYGDVPGWVDLATADRLRFPEMSVGEAVEVVASGAGIVIVPMGVARLHHRKDVEHRPVLDLAPTRIGLAWPVDTDDPRIETFIGIVRGRTENSSRGKPVRRRR